MRLGPGAVMIGAGVGLAGLAVLMRSRPRIIEQAKIDGETYEILSYQGRLLATARDSKGAVVETREGDAQQVSAWLSDRYTGTLGAPPPTARSLEATGDDPSRAINNIAALVAITGGALEISRRVRGPATESSRPMESKKGRR